MDRADAPTFPVALVLEGRKALLVGAGAECVAKIPRLLASRARVVVVSEEVPQEVATLARTGDVEWLARPYDAGDLADAAICFVDPSQASLGAALAEDARARGTLVCTLDRPEHATFVNVGAMQTGAVAITVSTGGKAPSVARAMREGLERAFADGRLARYVDAVGEARAAVPRGERAEEGRRLASGFSADIALVFPDWFDGM